MHVSLYFISFSLYTSLLYMYNYPFPISYRDKIGLRSNWLFNAKSLFLRKPNLRKTGILWRLVEIFIVNPDVPIELDTIFRTPYYASFFFSLSAQLLWNHRIASSKIVFSLSNQKIHFSVVQTITEKNGRRDEEVNSGRNFREYGLWPGARVAEGGEPMVW